MPKMFDLQSPDTPAALRDSLIFQYTDGTRFVGEVYLHGGWNAVNALYREPAALDAARFSIRRSTSAIPRRLR